eukprot:augustus_masked-scaffold_34-processed-gene-2.34-mRNA-1 protein AED:0.62 eAED:0.62 QI:0/-1/0/1/-1/1/1/0/244
MKLILIYDFDWSLVNENSDTFIFELQSTIKNELRDAYKGGKMTWTELMDHFVVRLQKEHGFSIDDIKQKIGDIPYFPEMLEVLALCKEKGSSSYIASDANDVYIDAFLSRHRVGNLIDAVFTNPTTIEENTGILRIHPLIPIEKLHGCNLCSANMCKGQILESIIQEAHDEAVRIIYIGDGSNDFCPATRLKETDILCMRTAIGDRETGLSKKVRQKGQLQCAITEWTNGAECLSGVKDYLSRL